MSPKRYTPYEVPEGTKPDPKLYDSKIYQKEDREEKPVENQDYIDDIL